MKQISLCVFAVIVLSLLPMSAQEPNPAVASILKSISPDSLRRNVEQLAGFGTRHTLSDTLSATRGIGAARRWIFSEFVRHAAASKGRMEIRFQETTVPPSSRIPAPTKVVNVVATLKQEKGVGSEEIGTGRVLLVGGHYDPQASDPMDATSDAPGANDDGSGTAVVLELARVLAPHAFDATIVFVAFAGEEQGLFGAAALADEAKAQGWNIEAVLNNDMVGNATSGDGTTDRSSICVFSQALSPADTGARLRSINTVGLVDDGLSRTLARYVEMVGEQYVPGFDVRLVYRLDRFLRGGDHRPFHERGFAAVRICEARENYDRQHQNLRTENGKEYGDLPKHVDFDYMAQAARLNASVLATLAWAPAPPARVSMDAGSLGYETVLRWQPNGEKDLSAYRVLYRESSSSVWQHHVEVSDTMATLKVLKDDSLFGVQAVDKDGNDSLPVVPTPRGR